jgi:uncharacterized protein
MTSRDWRTSAESISIPLADVGSELAAILSGARAAPVRYGREEIGLTTLWVVMRDGTRLATDVYQPPVEHAPAIAARTPYGRRTQEDTFLALARAGYVVVAQDCRGTGDSEPDHWDFYIYEREDSLDFVSWAISQPWYSGFLGALGGSYVGGTQWCMARHPQMGAIAPEVAGLGVAVGTGVRLHMFTGAYAQTVGKGPDKIAVDRDELEHSLQSQTLASGYFNDPLSEPVRADLVRRYPQLTGMKPAEARRWLWERYCRSGADERAAIIRLALGVETITIREVERLDTVFPPSVHWDAHLLPSVRGDELCQSLQAPAFMITGWYDWCLDDALRTWELLVAHAPDAVRERSRLLITPSAHNKPGYHEGHEDHPELDRMFRGDPSLLLHWYDAVRAGSLDTLPTVTYYLMGANQWCAASEWPPRQAVRHELYLGPAGTLHWSGPPDRWEPDRYTYDPNDPTPTLGGSVVSAVYPAGSVDVADLQVRSDVLTFTTPPLPDDVNVVGPLTLVLYASSSAPDTDFVARLSDVFPDDRAIQLQTGILRARYRDAEADPALLEPGMIYRLEIAMAATANRFAAGHRLRIDVSSADFPKFERNANRGGEPGPPVRAVQTIFHGSVYPSHLVVHILGSTP